MRRRLPTVLFVTAAALALAGSMTAILRSTGAERQPSDPRAAAVRALALRPGDVADSARYLVRYSIENPGIRREIGTYEGSGDFRRQRFLARGRLVPEDGPAREFDVFVFARWEYVRSPGEPWSRRFLQPQNLGTPTPELRIVGRRGDTLAAPAYANDLDVRRRIVDALIAGVLPLGREEHHGSPVWHYRVSVDGERAASELPEPVHREMRRWEEGKGRRDLDVWLDGRGRLRKLSIFYPDEQGRGFRVENEFWDFGGPGRIDLPTDLSDPTAVGGEGVTSYTASPNVKLDPESPGFRMWVFSPDRPDEDVTLHVDDQPDLGGDARRRFFRIRPASGRPLEPGEHRLVDRGEFNRGVALAVDLTTPEVDTRCPPDRPRSGNLTVIEAVQHEGGYYVRLHVRFTVSCRSATDGAPVTVTGEARYYSLT